MRADSPLFIPLGGVRGKGMEKQKNEIRNTYKKAQIQTDLIYTDSDFMKIIHFTILSFSLTFFFACNKSDKGNKKQFPAHSKTLKQSFAGSSACKECHQKEYKDWLGSDHQLAMQKADSNSVLADFNDKRFKSKGVDYHFYKNNGEYFVNTEGHDGKYHDFKIKYTFGVRPLQQYIVPFEKGKYQCLLSAWDTNSSKWFDLQPDLKIKHDEWMHWTGGSMTWNNMCADCHSTFVEKNYDESTESYNTTFVEINVGCEACHGPGAQHIEYYTNRDKYKDILPPKFYLDNNMDSKELVQKCARCHSRRSMVTNSFNFEGHYLDYYFPNLINYPVYEKDGQIQDEDYVVGSFMQSRMYNLEGVSCSNCHDMHTMKLKKEGNDLCLQCHEKKYDSYQHHFHKQNTEASQCINCHMTGRYYMGVDFRRDHSFRVPRPDQTVKYGTPNACNNCHKDKTAQWASDFIIEKYGKKRPKHFSDWLLPGQNGNIDSLKSLIIQTDFPEIVRATAVNLLSNQIYSKNELNVVLKMLEDKSPLVRREAIMTLVNMGQGYENAIEPRLNDSIRTVRIAAARYFVLNNIKIDNTGIEKAKNEFLTDLHVNSDFASGQHQLALYYMSQGDRKSAKKAYEKALEIDNYYNLSRMNLALMEYEDGNVEKAEKLYKKVIRQEPEYSYPYFMLGLLYNEKNRDKESLKYLGLACEKQPFILRAYYNYALKLQKSGNYKQADKVIDKALKVYPLDENMLYIKMLGKINGKKTGEAKEICKKLLEISPGNREYLRIMNSL